MNWDVFADYLTQAGWVVVTWVVGIALTAMLPLVVSYLYRKVKAGWADFYAGLNPEQQMVVGVVVQAVEQLAKNPDLLNLAGEKKALAMEWAQTILNQKGIPVSIEWLDALIEACILRGVEKEPYPPVIPFPFPPLPPAPE